MIEMPLFPLQSVLFPDMPIHLRIFEDRYHKMVQHCLKEDLPFGVVLIREGMEAFDPEVEIYTTGCTARITQVHHLQDGQLDLTARGEQRFRILKTSRLFPYLNAQVETFSIDWHEHPAAAHNLAVFRRQLRHYLKILSLVHKEPNDLSQLDLPDDALLLLYLGASILQIPAFEKQNLLEMDDSVKLMEELQHIYRREAAVLAAIQRQGTISHQKVRNN